MKTPLSFSLNPLHSPTFQNLAHYLAEAGWHSVNQDARPAFHEGHFDFDTKACEQLEYKHLLAELISEDCSDLMPETYCINDDNWPELLSVLLSQGIQGPWILKPALLNNGQSIQLFTSLDEVLRHYSTPKRLGGAHVLQRYIDNPQLLRGAHKYSMRVFVVLTNYAGAFIYPRGYCNVALTPYSPGDYSNKAAHLTNEHLGDESLGIVQIPSERFDFFPEVFLAIKTTLFRVMTAHAKKHSGILNLDSPARRLAIFGFDFMRDANQRLWLLEANHGPCFPVHATHPLYNWLYKDFWQDFIVSFVEPIARQSPSDAIQYRSFEPLT